MEPGKRIGIITHYFCSKNYGGNLQAYALCKVIQDIGYESEQICYKRWEDPPMWHRNRNVAFVGRVIKIIMGKCVRLADILHFNVKLNIKIREQCVLAFNKNAIPHSKEAFSYRTIANANHNYDIFITGSDQVWHPQAVCRAFLLDFADKEKRKISYAASISVNELTEEQKKRYQQSLSDYFAVSVREQKAVEILQPLLPIAPKWVLDPTLLLSRKQWDEICADRIVPEKYLFCYFLGEDKRHRHVAVEYAKMHGLKIVTLPHLSGRFCKCDRNFGDEHLYNVSPSQYISLIKFADCVLTDSFHSTVFSLIYEREFFVFDRVSSNAMGSRLYSLTSLFELENRFCDTPEKTTIEYLQSTAPIDYTKEFLGFNNMKMVSKDFLKNSIEKPI